ISAANDSDALAAHQRRIAARAVAYALTEEPLLAGNTELLQAGAGRDDDAARAIGLAVAGGESPSSSIRRKRGEFTGGELGTGGSRLLLRHRTEIVARDALGKTRIAVDLVDAEQLAAENVADQHQRLAAKPRAGEAGAQSRQAAARHYHIVIRAHGSSTAVVHVIQSPLQQRVFRGRLFAACRAGAPCRRRA